MNTSIKNLFLVGLIAGGFLVTGWLTGRYGPTAWTFIKQATVDSYLNRYRVMSDSGLSSIVYYVSTKDRAQLYAMAEQSTEIIEVADTKIKDLYDVRINYASRVPTVKHLRSMEDISAVITIPMICH